MKRYEINRLSSKMILRLHNSIDYLLESFSTDSILKNDILV